MFIKKGTIQYHKCWVSWNKRGRTRLETSKEEQKDNNMGTTTETMSQLEQGTLKRLLRNQEQNKVLQDMDLGSKDTV